jgi:hypothetical protein
VGRRSARGRPQAASRRDRRAALFPAAEPNASARLEIRRGRRSQLFDVTVVIDVDILANRDMLTVKRRLPFAAD